MLFIDKYQSQQDNIAPPLATAQADMTCLFGSSYTFQNQLFKLDLNTLNPKSYSFLTLGVVRAQVLL